MSICFLLFSKLSYSEAITTPQHSKYTIDASVSNSTEINLSLNLVYSFIFDDTDDINKVQILPTESLNEYKDISFPNSKAFMLIAKKIRIEAKEGKKTSFSVIAIEPGVCQQESFLFTYNGGIHFTVEHSVATRQFCFIPYKTATKASNLINATSLADDSRIFAANYAINASELQEDIDTNADNDFYVTYHDFNGNNNIKDVIEFDIIGSTEGQTRVNCSLEQIPFFDRSSTQRNDQQYSFSVDKCYDPLPEDKSESNTTLIIICSSVGAAVLVVIVIVVIVIMRKKKRATSVVPSEAVAPLIN